MIPLLRVFALLTLLALFASACSPDVDSTAPTAATRRPSDRRVFNRNDSGKEALLKPGGEIVVEAETNPSTGYQWSASYDKNVLELRSKELSGFSTAIGSPGTQTWIFIARAIGATKLELIYHRPWEKSATPTRTLTINVVVKE